VVGIILCLISGLAGALAGAFLSGRIMARAQCLSSQRHAHDQEARTLLNLFQALHAELTALWTGYTVLVGEELESLDKPEELTFAGIISASQYYFSVYDNTAHLLGTLEPDSGRRIIETYVNLKTYFDELNAYQILAGKARETRLKTNVNLYEAREVRQEHENFFNYLKKRHLQIKGQVIGVLEMLKEFITLGEQARTTVTVKI
jgi:glutaredoxin-related protein